MAALVLGDTEPLAHQVNTASERLGPVQRYAPGPELLELVQPVPAACSVPRLAAAAGCLGRVIG